MGTAKTAQASLMKIVLYLFYLSNINCIRKAQDLEDPPLAEEIKLHSEGCEVHDQEHQYTKTFGDALKDAG